MVVMSDLHSLKQELSKNEVEPLLPIEKKVRMKKMTRKVLASPMAAGTFAASSPISLM